MTRKKIPTAMTMREKEFQPEFLRVIDQVFDS
jgi:hypothetical protein